MRSNRASLHAGPMKVRPASVLRATTPSTPTATATHARAIVLAGVLLVFHVDVRHGLRLSRDDEATAMAVLTRGGERLDQALAHPLTRHLHEPERGDLSHLVTGPVAAKALDQSTQHEVAVGFEHHVDEVDHDDSTDIAQPDLPPDPLGGLKVVPRYGPF